MTTLNEMLSPVSKMNLAKKFGIQGNSGCSHGIFVQTKNEGQKMVSTCSDRYELVSNSTFLPQLRNEVLNTFGNGNVSERYSIKDNAIFTFEFIVDNQHICFGGNKKDRVKMKIGGRHSYNGQEQYKLEFGNMVYRQICSNGMMAWAMDEDSAFSITGKHTEKILSSIDLFKNNVNEFVNKDQLKCIAASYQPLYDNWVAKWHDRVIEVMNVAKIGTTQQGDKKGTKISKNVEHVVNVINSESKHLYDGAVNDWLIYNGINNLVYSDNYNATESARDKKDKAVFEALMS